MKTEQDSPVKDKHLLIAVDDSESSKRAVLYVADLLGSLPGFTVTLCSIIPAPEQDFFDREEQGQAWIKEKTAQAANMLENYRLILIQSGFSEDKVRIQSFVNKEKSFADAILTMRCDLTCCTVVVGRHHKSKTEEFLFGSTSSKLIHEAKNCAVWVVE
jgi:nucleotide-binding universal stress UspA family protein